MRWTIPASLALIASVAGLFGAAPSVAVAQPCATCPPLVDPFPSPWTARLKWVFMTRLDNGGSPLMQDVADGSTELRADDFDFDFESGLDSSLIYRTASGVGIEGRYLWFDDWSASAGVPNPGQLGLLTNPVTAPFADDFRGNYTSELQTAELNLRLPGGEVAWILGLREMSWILGFRYVDVNESLSIGSTTDLASFRTQNDLYGFQFGTEVVLLRQSRYFIQGFAKFGIYGNDADAQSRLVAGGLDIGRQSDGDVVGAFLTELGVDAVFNVSPHVALRVGYHGILIDGVALASDQVGRSGNFATSTSFPIDAGNQVFYHGVTTGVEVKW